MELKQYNPDSFMKMSKQLLTDHYSIRKSMMKVSNKTLSHKEVSHYPELQNHLCIWIRQLEEEKFNLKRLCLYQSLKINSVIALKLHMKKRKIPHIFADNKCSLIIL